MQPQNLEELLSIVRKDYDKKGLVRTIVVLATPSLASLLETVDFAKDLLPALYHGRRSFSGQPSKVVVQCIYGVVDALPVPAPVSHSVARPSPGLTGTEGLAVFLSSDKGDFGSYYASGTAHGGSEDGATTTLKFATAFTPSDLDAGDDQPTVTSRYVSLPVANTIFVNGKRATLFEDRWNIKLDGTREASIHYRYRKPLASCQIYLGCYSDEVVKAGSSPLQRLTEPRKVVGSMGNVLAQIEVGTEAVPASQELEKAVHAFIGRNPTSTAQGPLLVYALIRPEGMTTPEEGSRDGQPYPPLNVLEALWRGAKLFKVSGGGGGWGKRQGLLSLEAAVDFEAQEAQSTAGFPDLDSDQSILEALGSRGIIPPSSSVEFLVHSPSPASAETQGQKHISRLPERKTTIVMLGTGADPDSRDDAVKDADNKATGVQFVPHHFGMISYGGAALNSISQISRSTLPPIKRTETRLDVPNSCFILHSVREPSEVSRAGEGSEATRKPH
jgi:V-type H+-transporting ATPase proteolipid subunit